MSITLTVQLTDFTAIGTAATVLGVLLNAANCFISFLTYKKNQ